MNRGYKNKTSFNYSKASFTLLFFTSCILLIFVINFFKETVIEYQFLFFLSFFGSIITFIISSKVYKRLHTLFWQLIASIIIGSSLFSFIFLYVNKAFVAKNEIISVKVFEIIDKGTLGKRRYSNCHKPYVVINFFGTEKQLEFLCEYQKSVSESQKIRLTFAKGFFGFYVIKSKQLLTTRVQ